MTQPDDRAAPDRLADALFRLFLKESIQGVIVFDDDWRPLFVNNAYVALFGFDSASEILALPTVESLISRVDRERLRTYRFARPSGRKVPKRYDFTGIRKDGGRLSLEATITRVELGGVGAVCTTVSDVTVARRMARETAARQHRLRLQHQALIEVARFEGRHTESHQNLTEVACRTLAVERTGLWLMDPSQRVATLADRYFNTERRHTAGNKLPRNDYPVWFEALATGRSIAADDAGQHEATIAFADGYLAEQGISSVLAAPIRSGSDLHGFVSCEHIGPARRWSEDEQQFLAALADLVVQALERQRREAADARARASDARYRRFFTTAPVALWEEDWRRVGQFLETLGKGDTQVGIELISSDPDRLQQAVALLDILDVNRAAVELTGTGNAGACKAHLRGAMLQMTEFGFIDRLRRMAAGEHRFSGTTFMRRAGGEVADVRLRVECDHPDPDNCGRVLVIAEDVSEHRAMARALAWQASHDVLTGLIGRHEFERRAATSLASLASSGQQHVIAFIDIDQFKIVNDTSGHAAGDQLLALLAGELARAVRGNDLLARLGGDEFAVLMEHCTLDDARTMAESLRQVIADYRFVWEGQVFSLGASIGLATMDYGADLTRVLADADAACVAAKEAGRNRVHLYQAGNEKIAARRGHAAWVARLQGALDEDAFGLVGQPVVPLDPSAQSSEQRVEVLLRLRTEPDGGGPATFMPAAERFGLSSTLDRWVLNRTLELMEAGRNDRIAVSVNLSGHSLGDDDFLDFARKRIVTSNIAPSRLCFEITESAAVGDLKAANRLIAELRSLGCGFALDDFGRGLSSFAYLKALPVDFLKIDGLFVRGIVRDEVDRSMVRTINEVAHTAGIRTVAEFVETTEVLEVLRTIGVDYAQGFAVGRSLPLGEVLR